MHRGAVVGEVGKDNLTTQLHTHKLLLFSRPALQLHDRHGTEVGCQPEARLRRWEANFHTSRVHVSAKGGRKVSASPRTSRAHSREPRPGENWTNTVHQPRKRVFRGNSEGLPHRAGGWKG